jgi:hypothetical protein
MTVDGLALFVGVFGFALSIYVFVQQRIDHRREREVEVSREDYAIMLDFYQSWLSPAEQDCRKAIYRARDQKAAFADLPDDVQGHINHAIAMMNVVALLRSAGRVPVSVCDELFGGAMVRVVAAAESIGYFTWRKSLTGSTPWPRLRDAAKSLEASGSSQGGPELFG